MIIHLHSTNKGICAVTYRGAANRSAHSTEVISEDNFHTLQAALHALQSRWGRPLLWDFFPGMVMYNSHFGMLLAVTEKPEG